MRPIFAAACTAAALAVSAPAGALVVTLGEQDYADGAMPAGLLFNNASVGEPAPFNGFIGDDNNTNFSASWTFNFAPASYSSATLRLAIFDHDSMAPGSQVDFFSIDNNDVTALLDGIFESSGGAQGELNIYDVPIPALLLSELDDGTMTFMLTLEGITISSLGVVLPDNGAGLDFAQLLLDETSIVEPGTLALLAAGLAALGLVRIRARAARA